MTGAVATTRMSPTITRCQVARLLRAARTAFRERNERAGDLIGWAFTALRDSIPVRKLKIDFLLSVDQWDSADALIARTIMQGHDEPMLRFRHARSLHAQGRLKAASAEVSQVLKIRPTCIRAMALAARIAADLNDLAEAITLFTLADDARPRDPEIGRELVNVLLKAGLIHRAAARLERMPAPPITLVARVLKGQRRMLEAMDLLQSSIERFDPAEHNCAEREEMLLLLLEFVDETLDVQRLESLSSMMATASAAARQRAARTHLLVGRFSTVPALHVESGPDGMVLCAQSPIAAIARSLSGNQFTTGGFANKSTQCESLHLERNGSSQVADLWLRGMAGALWMNQMNGRRTGADPVVAILPALLRRAVAVLQQNADSGEMPPSRQLMVERHCQVCREILGAAAGLPTVETDSTQIQPNSLRQAA